MIRPLNKILRPGLHHQLSRLVSQSREVNRLNMVLSECLPTGLAAYCRVANHHDHKLVLSASTSAYATKLRFLAPEIKKHFQDRLNLAVSIHIKVAVLDAIVKPPPSSRRLTMTADAAKVIAETAADINDVNLQAALLRLARHGQTG